MEKLVADTAEITDLEQQFDVLDRNGYLLVRGALNLEMVEAWRECLTRKYNHEEWDISNEVGNVAFDHLLEQEPDLARPLVGHASVAPYLKAMLGRQCQLRSFRAHINPAAYTQEWHKDFGYYWDAPDEARHALRPLCITTTFYLTDITPETGRLTFFDDFCHNALPEEIRHLGGYNSDNPFYQWCEKQPHTHLYPMTGDAVVFFSHIPHQGAKLRQENDGEPLRCNVVLHYQQTPMFPGIPFVSSPLPAIEALGYNGTFPFIDQ